jgi:hypothetical protein
LPVLFHTASNVSDRIVPIVPFLTEPGSSRACGLLISLHALVAVAVVVVSGPRLTRSTAARLKEGWTVGGTLPIPADYYTAQASTLLRRFDRTTRHHRPVMVAHLTSELADEAIWEIRNLDQVLFRAGRKAHHISQLALRVPRVERLYPTRRQDDREQISFPLTASASLR